MHIQLEVPLHDSLNIRAMPVPGESYWDSDNEDCPPSPSSSDSSFDEEEANQRVRPFWPKYRSIFQSLGYQLDTVRDVREFYKNHCSDKDVSFSVSKMTIPVISHGREGSIDDDALCPDAGLPDNLFRGTRQRDATKVVVKAVNFYSREYEVIRLLSQPPLRNDPMNHTIPVLDLIEVPDDEIVFIVMEEWSSQLITDRGPCCLGLFLMALRQCLEHAAFMHKHHIAHLDISLRNLLTDYEGRYAYIDYELSRRFDGVAMPRLHGYRGTEVPPECEKGEASDPYKIDVWALGVLILRACKLTGYDVSELMPLVKLMLHERPDQRPSIFVVIQAFDRLVASIGRARLQTTCISVH